jgi:S1-C subfamily serine protease
VVSEDAYGRGPVTRRITAIRGLVRSGNSGGPVVDGDGEVVATVFAATVGNGGQTGYGVPDTVVRGALARAGDSVGTGPCAR